MKIRKRIYDELIHDVPDVPPEVGIILGGKGGIVECFHVDIGLSCMNGCYVPDTGGLNAVIEDWTEKGTALIGFAHTHHSVPTLSSADKIYIREIMNALKSHFDILHFPVVIPKGYMVNYTATIEGDNLTITRGDLYYLA